MLPERLPTVLRLNYLIILFLSLFSLSPPPFNLLYSFPPPSMKVGMGPRLLAKLKRPLYRSESRLSSFPFWKLSYSFYLLTSVIPGGEGGLGRFSLVVVKSYVDDGGRLNIVDKLFLGYAWYTFHKNNKNFRYIYISQ